MTQFTRTKKFNPNHDAKGLFTHSPGGASAAAEFEGPSTAPRDIPAERARSEADRAAAHATLNQRMGGRPVGPKPAKANNTLRNAMAFAQARQSNPGLNAGAFMYGASLVKHPGRPRAPKPVKPPVNAGQMGKPTFVTGGRSKKIDYTTILKYHDVRGADGKFAVGMPAGTEGKNAQPDVQGPRSGEGKGTTANRGGDLRTDPVQMAPAPATSVEGQDAGGIRSDDNKAVPNNEPTPSGSVSGPRSGENAGTPAVSQQNDALTAAAAPSGQDAGGQRSGVDLAVPDSGLPAGTAPTAGGPRSGENQATNDSNSKGLTNLTLGVHGHSASTQRGEGVKGPAALFADGAPRGTKVRLRSGAVAKMEDNKKGNTRLATVYGARTYTGSIHTNDITHVQKGGEWVKV